MLNSLEKNTCKNQIKPNRNIWFEFGVRGFVNRNRTETELLHLVWGWGIPIPTPTETENTPNCNNRKLRARLQLHPRLGYSFETPPPLPKKVDDCFWVEEITRKSQVCCQFLNRYNEPSVRTLISTINIASLRYLWTDQFLIWLFRIIFSSRSVVWLGFKKIFLVLF